MINVLIRHVYDSIDLFIKKNSNKSNTDQVVWSYN